MVSGVSCKLLFSFAWKKIMFSFESMKRSELEDRLIAFSASVITITNSLPRSISGLHLARQITRSSTSVTLNYGEAQGAESRRDFIHKMRISLKELRETYACLKLIREIAIYRNQKLLDDVISENNELISIFVVSLKTSLGKNRVDGSPIV